MIHIAASIALALLGTDAMADRWTPIESADAPTRTHGTFRRLHSHRRDGSDDRVGRTGLRHDAVREHGRRVEARDQRVGRDVDRERAAGRQGHPAIWTGHEMIVWGGDDGQFFMQSGGRYDPVANRWRPTSLAGAPSERFGHSMVWTGDRMIVWGGAPGFIGDLDTGGIYDPFADTWTPTANERRAAGAQRTRRRVDRLAHGRVGRHQRRELHQQRRAVRSRHEHMDADLDGERTVAAAVLHADWDGSSLFIWGGVDSQFQPVRSGAIYNVETDTWRPVAPGDAPVGRLDAPGVWTGRVYIVWGGSDNQGETARQRRHLRSELTDLDADDDDERTARALESHRRVGRRPHDRMGWQRTCCNNWFNDGTPTRRDAAVRPRQKIVALRR
jgi:hypothetical protein